jgi:hypothetical protein
MLVGSAVGERSMKIAVGLPRQLAYRSPVRSFRFGVAQRRRLCPEDGRSRDPRPWRLVEQGVSVRHEIPDMFGAVLIRRPARHPPRQFRFSHGARVEACVQPVLRYAISVLQVWQDDLLIRPRFAEGRRRPREMKALTSRGRP